MAATIRATDSIYELDLPIRASNALMRNDVREVGELVNLTEADFLRMRGVGVTALEKVKSRLAAHGLSMAAEPPPPPDPTVAAEAEWIGRQIDALVEDNRIHARNRAGGRYDGEGHELLNRRRAWAWYRSFAAADEDWPRDNAGGFGYLAVPLPGSMELHLEGLNRLAHAELDGD